MAHRPLLTAQAVAALIGREPFTDFRVAVRCPHGGPGGGAQHAAWTCAAARSRPATGSPAAPWARPSAAWRRRAGCGCWRTTRRWREPLAAAHARHEELHARLPGGGLRRPGARQVPARAPGVRDGGGRIAGGRLDPERAGLAWPARLLRGAPAPRAPVNPASPARDGPLRVGGRPRAHGRARAGAGGRAPAGASSRPCTTSCAGASGSTFTTARARAGLRRRAGVVPRPRGPHRARGSPRPGSPAVDPRRGLRHLRPLGVGRAPMSTSTPGSRPPPPRRPPKRKIRSRWPCVLMAIALVAGIAWATPPGATRARRRCHRRADACPW